MSGLKCISTLNYTSSHYVFLTILIVISKNVNSMQHLKWFNHHEIWKMSKFVVLEYKQNKMFYYLDIL